MKKRLNKVGALHAGCVAFAMAGCLAVTGMGISMVNTLANDSMSEVQAAENRARTYVVSLQDEADRISAELNAEQEAELRQEIADAEERMQDSLDEHEKEADARFDALEEGMSGEGSDEEADNVYAPAMGEPGFNEP